MNRRNRTFLRLTAWALLLCLLCHDLLVNPMASSANPIIQNVPVSSEAPVEEQAANYFRKGIALYRAGDHQAAIQNWQNALDLLQDPEKRAKVLTTLAVTYQNIGQYQNAIAHSTEALTTFQTISQNTEDLESSKRIQASIGQVQNLLGKAYEAVGRYEDAEQAYRENIRIAEEIADRELEGVALSDYGYFESVRGNQKVALSYYKRSLDIAQAIEDHNTESIILFRTGIVYLSQAKTDLAEQSYRRSLEIARQLENTKELQAQALNGLGLTAAENGHHEEAITHLTKSLTLAKEVASPNLIAAIANNLGHTLFANGQLKAASHHLNTAITHLDSLRTNLTDAYSISLFDQQIYTYNLLTQVLVADKQPEAALEASEAGRARAFSDLLQLRSQSAVEDVVDSNRTAISLEGIRAIAQKLNTTLVEYSLVPEDSFRAQGKQKGKTASIDIWVIQPNGHIDFRQQAVTAETGQLERWIEINRHSLGARTRDSRASLDVIDGPSPDATESLKALHHLLIEPIQDLLPKTPESRVAVIPQGQLFLVPFPALIDGNSKVDNDYLIHHHTLLSAPSIQILALTQQRHLVLKEQDNQTSLVVGNPDMPIVRSAQTQKVAKLETLKNAEREAKEVSDILETEPLLGRDASEQVIKNRIESAGIVHFATHGLLEYGTVAGSGNSDIPGAIALTAGNEQDGLLTASEILNDFSLNADMVVLSACDTGNGEITGDGIIGLARAFIASGTPSVVVSLWSIPDAPTADLMIQFHQAFADKKDKAQALRSAMIETLKTHPNPKDWAAFTLVGEAS